MARLKGEPKTEPLNYVLILGLLVAAIFLLEYLGITDILSGI
jgi:hypothetical protein